MLQLFIIFCMLVSHHMQLIYCQTRNENEERTTENEDIGFGFSTDATLPVTVDFETQTEYPNRVAIPDAADETDMLLNSNGTNDTDTIAENGTVNPEAGREDGTATTIIPPSNTSELPSSPPFKGDTKKELTVKDFCLCDLKVGACDVNCCCDEDCYWEDKKVFSHCEERPQPTLDINYCFQEQLLFSNHTEYTVAFTHPGAFCIITDNLPQRTTYTLVKGATNLDEYKKLKNNERSSYSWLPSESASPISLEPYRDGTHVWALDEMGTSFTLGLPISVVGSVCETSTPVLYLQDIHSSCSQELENLALECQSNVYLSVHHYLSFSIVANPETLFKNQSVETTTETSFPGSTTMLSDMINEENTVDSSVETTTPLTANKSEDVIESKSQQEKIASYSKIMEAVINSSQLHPSQLVSVRPLFCQRLEDDEVCSEMNFSDVSHPTFENGTCNNVLLSVEYTFFHNGSQGVYDVQAKVYLTNLTVNLTHIRQRFSSKFLWGASDEEMLERSGHPGYLRGKPLVMGKLIQNRTEEDIVKEAVSLDTDPTTWLSILAPGSLGKCDASSQVIFGVDLRAGCLFEITREDFVHDCHLLQTRILQRLLGPAPLNDGLLRVASYGDASVNNPSGDWVPILVPEEPVCGTSNKLFGKSQHFSLVTSVHLEVAFSLQGSLANPQAKVVGVRLTYGEPEEVRPTCLRTSCPSGESANTLELKTSVLFVDVSRPPLPAYSKPPALDVKLPYDFFYPFLPSTASSWGVADIQCLITSAIVYILIVGQL